MFKVILFLKFSQFWFKFLLILKIGYLFDLTPELLDYGFIVFFFISFQVDSKFVKF